MLKEIYREHEVSNMSNKSWSCVQAGRGHAKGTHIRGMEEDKSKDFQLPFWGQSSVKSHHMDLQVFIHPGLSTGQATALIYLAKSVTTEKYWKDCNGCLQEEPPARHGCAM